ncbi:DUF4199 domain-containing protein [Rhodohalobacter sp. SW132]|uniref:DUF4199 domain-containing protein n=1 Tax=Rhodohalobacter sp. SW132 TaxID=2293433 RepID=UPI000E25D426|nr:DUF4199 domain-containing protein [Rhodohalobacter sp. SW132]REL38906.1 DUF4199 domain-containing protein [Rhodohalobacter sp. SW132]
MDKFKHELKWGAIFTLVMLIWMMFERIMGWHTTNIANHATASLFFALPAIAVFVAALLEKRKKAYSGVMTWRQGVICGFYITIVIVLLNPLAQIIIHTVITPDYLQNMIEYSVSSGVLERDEAEAYFSLTNYMVQGVIGTFFMGVVTSAVVAAFIRKSKD